VSHGKAPRAAWQSGSRRLGPRRARALRRAFPGFFRKGETVSWTLASRFYGDFAPIRSLAWPRVHAADPSAVYKSSLERQYQYNLGFSNRSYACSAVVRGAQLA
jgi:hypothetical protein